MAAEVENLRLHLRRSTAQAHDRLDLAMRSAALWSTRDGYRAFLELQFAARKSVEGWLAGHAPARLAPPEQSGLIAADLAAMGAGTPRDVPAFTHGDSGETAVLGIAWSLAGSSLGNRAILKDVRRAAGESGNRPVAFLSDNAMPAFWSGLRSSIERPAEAVEAETAAAAATALFDHFTSAIAARHLQDMALAS